MLHYNDVIMGAMASQITSLTIVYSTVYSGADQRKHQSSASPAFMRGIPRSPVNSPHKWPVTPKMFPFDDVIMWVHYYRYYIGYHIHIEILGESPKSIMGCWPDTLLIIFSIGVNESTNFKIQSKVIIAASYASKMKTHLSRRWLVNTCRWFWNQNVDSWNNGCKNKMILWYGAMVWT